jgi:heat shock protein HtpX
MIAFGLVTAIGFLSDMAMRMFFWGGDDRDRDQSPIVMIVGIIVVILAPIVATMIQLAISRQREYLADATGAMTVRDPEGLISALEKLKKESRPMQRQDTSTAHLFFSNPLKPGMLASLFSTHPPLDDRIARLRNNEGKF